MRLGRKNADSAPEVLDAALAVRATSLSKVYHPEAKRMHEIPVSVTDRILGKRSPEPDEEDEDEPLPDEGEDAVLDAFAEDEIETDFVWGLRDVTFDLPRGQAVAIVGEPRSGKTTLLSLLAGNTPPTTGRALVRGRIWPPLSYLTTFMEAGITVRQNAAIAAKVANVPRKVFDRSLEQIYQLLEITPAAALRATGNRTRAVALATGLVIEPSVLLLDDPAIFGDVAFEQAAIRGISELRDQGTTILLEEPDHELIDSLCDQIVWLQDGRVRRVGPKDVLLPEYVSASAERTKFPRIVGTEGGPVPLRSFSHTAAILSAGVESEDGTSIDLVGSDDTVVFHVVLELAEAPTGVRCAIALTRYEGQAIWVEEPSASTVQSPGRHDLYAFVRGADLPGGAYTGHVEVITSRNHIESTIGRADLFTFQVGAGSGSSNAPASPTAWLARHAEWRTGALG